jgi:hypothetical protein
MHSEENLDRKAPSGIGNHLLYRARFEQLR